MISVTDIVRALYGAWRLALFDPKGHTFFDISTAGFWRSFQAALVIAPLFILLIIGRYVADQIETPFARYLPVELSAYTLSWLVFPVVTEWLTRTLGCRDRFIGFIIAYNWAMVPQYLIFSVVILLGLTGLIPADTADGIALILLIWTFVFNGFICKTALDVPVSTAAGVVFLDFLLGLTLDLVITG